MAGHSKPAETLYRVIAVLLIGMAIVLLIGHGAASSGSGQPLFGGPVQIVVGMTAGFAIGVVASLLGVAGGELLIPTLILLFAFDVKWPAACHSQ